MATKIKIKQTAVSGRLPSSDPTNSAYIEQGELALNTADQLLFSKDSNGNIFPIGGSGGSSSTIDEFEFIATAGQTDFTITGGYAGGDYIEVYLNGIKLLESIDFTHTNGSEVVLAEASELDDEITIKIIGDIDVAAIDWNALNNVPAVITNIQSELDSNYTSKTITVNTTLDSYTEYETGSNLVVNNGVLLTIPTSSQLVIKSYASGKTL